MYLRAAHAETSPAVLQQLVREHPLGVLTTALSSMRFPLIQVSHIPFVLDVRNSPASLDDDDSPGTLRGHLIRVNPQAKALSEAASASSDGRRVSTEVLVLFNGVNSYVPPRFYSATKPTTGKVVPTWNYAAVQAYGMATVYHSTSDAATNDFLDKQISDLTDQQEESISAALERGEKWKVDDAPAKYVDTLKKAIIGIEIKLTRLEGKWKMSQEVDQDDRAGVVAGFQGMESEEAKEVARLVADRAPCKHAA